MNRKLILRLLAIAAGTLLISVLFFDDFDKEKIDYSKYFDPNTKWYKDKTTLAHVQKLHPDFKGKIAKFLTELEQKLGLQGYITSGYRTFAEQTALYNQNNSNGKPGYSMHNYGFAVDMNIKDSKGNIILRKANSSKEWKDKGVVDLAFANGLKWGGDRQFGDYHDPIHFFEEPKGKKSSELLALYNSGQRDPKGYVVV